MSTCSALGPGDPVRPSPACVIEVPAELAPEARERFERRDGVAAAAAVRTSCARLGRGGRRVRHAADRRRRGAPQPRSRVQRRLHAVNPRGGSIEGLPCTRRADVPGASTWPSSPCPAGPCSTSRATARAGRARTGRHLGRVRGAGEGGAPPAELLDVCRAGGMRLVGPNCLGVLKPTRRCGSTRPSRRPARSRAASPSLSQSGALGDRRARRGAQRGLGPVVVRLHGQQGRRLGQRPAAYWEHDPDTDVVLLYLESFGNPRSSGASPAGSARAKPIIAVKSGRSAAGARAAASHTGALWRRRTSTVDALFAQAGVIRTDTVGELFDVGDGARRAAAADRRSGRHGHQRGRARDPLRRRLRGRRAAGQPARGRHPRGGCRVAARDRRRGNPVDMIAAATAEDFGARSSACGRPGRRRGDRDLRPADGHAPGRVGAAIRRAGETGRDTAARRLHGGRRRGAFRRGGCGVPFYGYTRGSGARAGARGPPRAWRRARQTKPPLDGSTPSRRRRDRRRARTGGDGWLAPAVEADAPGRLRRSAVAVRFAPTAAAAGRCAAALGYPWR